MSDTDKPIIEIDPLTLSFGPEQQAFNIHIPATDSQPAMKLTLPFIYVKILAGAFNAHIDNWDAVSKSRQAQGIKELE